MSKDKTGFSRIITELQRWGVFKVIAMYAASAIIILQLFDIITPALALPKWIVTAAVILLAFG